MTLVCRIVQFLLLCQSIDTYSEAKQSISLCLVHTSGDRRNVILLAELVPRVNLFKTAFRSIDLLLMCDSRTNDSFEQ